MDYIFNVIYVMFTGPFLKVKIYFSLLFIN